MSEPNATAPEARIVPDYVRPSALMVPHYSVDILPLLEEIAVAASAHVGVILLSGDAELSEGFVARQRHPERFQIIGGEFDTPWIRDRSPIAVSERGLVSWVIPKMPDMERRRDDALFTKIAARPARDTSILIAQGNLVAGPDGVALSTRRVLDENGMDGVRSLSEPAAELGIRHWIVFPPFQKELSGHADVHARFLSPDLLAVAWNASDEDDRGVANWIEEGVRSVLPDIRCLRLPMHRDGEHCASPLNWLQFDETLLVPRYPPTPDKDRDEIAATLGDAGFETAFIESPTLEFGGSLHCLTASVYV